jgi:hypothetical protein
LRLPPAHPHTAIRQYGNTIWLYIGFAASMHRTAVVGRVVEPAQPCCP